MIKDIIKINIFQDGVDFEYVGEHEVLSWSDQVLIGNEYKTFSDGYVPYEPEEICKYLMNEKRAFREQILYLQSLIDTINLELMKQYQMDRGE